MAISKEPTACEHKCMRRREVSEDEPGVIYEYCVDCGAVVGATTKLVNVPDELTCPCCKARLHLAEKDGEEFLEAIR